MIKSNLHEDNDDETERGVLLSVKALINEGNFAIKNNNFFQIQKLKFLFGLIFFCE